MKAILWKGHILLILDEEKDRQKIHFDSVFKLHFRNVSSWTKRSFYIQCMLCSRKIRSKNIKTKKKSSKLKKFPQRVYRDLREITNWAFFKCYLCRGCRTENFNFTKATSSKIALLFFPLKITETLFLLK